MSKSKPNPEGEITSRVLKHWQEAVPDDRLAHLVKDAARSFLRSLQARLAPEAVSLGHWTFLRILWEQDGITQRELSYEAGVMEPTTVVALRSMEELGYVVRKRRPEDGRSILVHLTRKGRALKERLIPLAEEVNTLAVAGLSNAEIASMRRSLLIVLENLARDQLPTDLPANAQRQLDG